MKIIFLCAGYATRLYPLTENQPKPLLPVAGRPIVDYTLDQLEAVPGIEEVILVTNHKFAGHFERWAAAERRPWPLSVVDDQTVSNDDRRGAIGDLIYVLQQKKITDSDVTVIAGDNLFASGLQDFFASAGKNRPHASVGAYDVKDLALASQYGILQVAPENGKVIEFWEKPTQPPSTLASCGLYYLPAEACVLLDRYQRESHNVDQPGHFMRWLSQVSSLYAVSLKGNWYDIGDKASYEQANTLFRNSKLLSGKDLES